MQEKTKNILSNILSAILTIVSVFLFLFSVCFLTYNLSCGKTRVRGFSMQPTINSHVNDINQDGDMVYINPNAELGRDSIVVANVSWWSSGSIIKRLVGLPGDSIQILEQDSTYELRVNGQLIYIKKKVDSEFNVNINVKKYYQNKYLKFISNSTQFDGNHIDHSNNIGEYDGQPCIVLGEDEYFLIGDNWSDGMVDCMTYGPISKANIKGVVDLVVDVEDSITMSVGARIFKILFGV